MGWFSSQPERPRRQRLTRQLRREIFERDDYSCHYCGFSSSPGRAGDELDIDHKKPLARGGTNSKRNLVTACNRCNNQKGRRTKSEYLRWRKGNSRRSSVMPHQRGGGDPLRSVEQMTRVNLWQAFKKFFW